MKPAQRPPVVVVGTIFVDLKCFPYHELNFKGRNLGRAEYAHGGVGRNVAETMALMGSAVRFSASVQEGGVGHDVLTRLHEAGVDVDGVNVVPQPGGHGMWVAILHRDGDLACSISQPPDVSYMEEAWDRHGDRLLQDAGLVVLELDVADKLAERVLIASRAAGVPVIGLPGNFDCIRRRPELLPMLTSFVCNQYEAEELYGKPVTSVPAAKNAARAILDRGLSQIVVTLGGLGSVAYERSMAEPKHIPALEVEVVDTTGAGDSFVAGFSHAIAQGASLEVAVQAASRVAAWTVSSTESVCRDLADRIAADTWEGWRALETPALVGD
ncbi:MAG: PfkB family carbohydrate kinase [Mycobacterium leprae]